MYLFTITSQHDTEDSMYCCVIWSNWKHIFQSLANTVLLVCSCSHEEEATKKIYFACDFSTLTALFPSWFAYKTVSNASCLYILYWQEAGILVQTIFPCFDRNGLFFHSAKKFYIWGRKNGSTIIDFMRFYGFCKKEISLSWYVLSNYSKNADSWINGWIVSRLLRLLAGIEQTVSQMIMIRYYCTVITAIRQS